MEQRRQRVGVLPPAPQRGDPAAVSADLHTGEFQHERFTVKRDELKSIIPDITGEQVNQIMAIHGADIERHKQQLAALTAERDEAKGKYHETAARLAGLDAEYKAKVEAAEQATAETLDGMQREFEFQNAARAAMAEIKFTSNAARKEFLAELEARNLPVQAGKIIGFDEYYAEMRKADPAAFESSFYPTVKDGGDPCHPVTVPEDPVAAFGKFVNDALAWDPRTDSKGWTYLGRFGEWKK